MKQAAVKTAKQARAEFERLGIPIAAWCRTHKVGKSLVYEILAGRKKCHRGQSHRVAVLLGMKQGEIAEGVQAVNAPAFDGTERGAA